MQRALSRLAIDKTVLVIAHHLAAVVHCDLIVMLEHGCIAEQGRHDELLARERLYARLWRLQQQAEPHAVTTMEQGAAHAHG